MKIYIPDGKLCERRFQCPRCKCSKMHTIRYIRNGLPEELAEELMEDFEKDQVLVLFYTLCIKCFSQGQIKNGDEMTDLEIADELKYIFVLTVPGWNDLMAHTGKGENGNAGLYSID